MTPLPRNSVSALADLRKSFFFIATLFIASGLYSQPIINSFSPTSGPVGTTVTITGSNFNTIASHNIVYFGATRAVVSSSTLTSVTVSVPAGTTYEPIIVTDADSLLVAYSAKPFTATFNGGATNQTVIAPLSISNPGTVNYTRDIVVGDLDGDGKSDIVTTSYINPSVSILRNISVPGTTAFAPQIEMGISYTAYDINLSDLNGDGKLDLLITNSSTFKLNIYKNTSTPGNISFAAPVTVSVSGYFRVADIDGDGKQDIISVEGGPNEATVGIYQNKIINGNITTSSFSLPVFFLTGLSTSALVVTDVDGDKKPDVVVTNRSSNSVSVLKNTSVKGIINASSLAPRVDFGTDLAPAGIEAGDLDGDGKPDLVICNEDGGSISVLRNTSVPGIINSGTFASSVKFASGSGAVALALGDIDGDDKPDIAVANYISKTIAVFKNISVPGSFSTSSLAAKVNFTAGFAPFGIKIVDIDGDNKPEIVTTNQGERYVSILQTNINTLPPKINSFLPDTLGIGGIATIYGKYFSGINSVRFGNAEASSFSALSDTVITATVSNLGASGKIKVTTSLGSDSISGFNFIPPPLISSFTPVLAGIDDTVIIRGKNFYRVTAVIFGSTAAKGFSVISDSTIAAVVAKGSSGSVTVTTEFGTGLRNGFTFVPFPVMTFFSPVIAGAGDTVLVHGANFTTLNRVRFGEADADWFQLVSDTLIRARLGKGLSGAVEVTTIGGAIALPGFTFSNVPTISSFIPMSGPVGTAIKITGTLFDEIPGNNIVYFGVVRAVVTNASATSLTVTVPPGASYSPITVTVNRRTAYSTNPFTVTFSANDSIFNAASFASRIQFPNAAVSKSLSIGDLNNDGKPDFAIASADPSIGTHTSFSAMANATNGGNISFVPKVSLTIPGVLGGREITLGDLDGDGNLDAGMASDAEFEPISYFRNTTGTTGEVSFSTATRPSVVGHGYHIKSADLDGDGRPDLAVAGSELGSAFVYRNTSSGSSLSFDGGYSLFVLSSSDLVIADMDGDQKPDIVIANVFRNLTVFRNKSTIGKIAFDEGREIPGSSNAIGIVAGDIDGDGKLDLAVAGSSNLLSMYRNTSSVGSVSFASRIDYTRTARYDPSDRIAIGDLDGDGKPDLAISNIYSSDVSLFKNKSSNGLIAFNEKVNYAAGTNPSSLAIGDIDNDGKPEIVLVNSNTNIISVLKNQINKSPEPAIASFSPVSGLAGTMVTIKGSHFTGAINVSFGDISASSFTVVSDTVITAILASGASGSVEVLAPGGMASLNGFSYGGPVIKSFTPRSWFGRRNNKYQRLQFYRNHRS